MIILLQAETLLENADKVSPFSEYVYGFLVLLLVAALVFVWKQAQSWQKAYIELNEKALVIFEKISHGYEEDKELKIEIKTLLEIMRMRLKK